ncbi:MAG: ATP-dependent sacrificial sulfur transferase LarE [Longimicrobiales bacterium]
MAVKFHWAGDALHNTDTPDLRLARLEEILRACGSVCIGYSGGVDSVFLAKVALDVLGPENVLAVTGRSEAYPEVQRDMALECSREHGIPHLEIHTDELQDPNYAANPTNRCYFCKSELWTRLRGVADAHDLAYVLDGSNADDARDYRPGMQAAREREVRSPLLEAGLTKEDIRMFSQRLNLPTWDQPSSPCLSSRLPYGLAVTPQRLREVEAAEVAVRALGFRDFRVRHHGDAARIELPAAELPAAAAGAAALATAVRGAGFTRVLLDVEGYRRGALNEVLVSIGGVRDAKNDARDAKDDARGARDAWSDAVEAIGHANDIAVLMPDTDFAQLRERAAVVRERGYRYATIDLDALAGATCAFDP